jgi:uncharacterized protein YprB with RNaseH-like and TPR domain
MIKNSFIFLPRIKAKKEKSIWSKGIRTWEDFLNKDVRGISKKTKYYYDREIRKAAEALQDDNSSYFVGKLPTTETWRLYPFFKEQAAFLDIETSGTGMKSYLTVLGLFDGFDTKIMIRDVNLDINSLKQELKKYKIIVTFNGSSFDLPYLNRKYPDLLPKIPHFDLRHACSRLGLTGGLKQIEKQLGIHRDNIIIERFYDGDPIKLWRMFKGSGDDYYLKLLVEYNEEDIINLKKISDHAVDKLINTISF